MSLVTGLARLSGRILLSVHMGNFSPVDRDEIQQKKKKQKKKNKMVEHKFVSLPAVVALGTFVTFLTKLIRILLKWKYMQDKNYTILAAMSRMRSYFGLKKVRPTGSYP